MYIIYIYVYYIYIYILYVVLTNLQLRGTTFFESHHIACPCFMMRVPFPKVLSSIKMAPLQFNQSGGGSQ